MSPSLDAVHLVGGDAYWLDGTRKGTVRHWSRQTGTTTAVDGVDVGTGIYGYGGGAYIVTEAGVFACDQVTGGIVHAIRDGRARRLDTGPQGSYGDLHWSPHHQRLLAVRERGASADVVAIDPTSGTVDVVVADVPFVAAPRISPDGSWLAWLSWEPPAMPWDATTLWVAPFSISAQSVHANTASRLSLDDVSLFCPRWSSDGTLHVVSDHQGWWNLYRVTGLSEPPSGLDLEPLVTIDAELGVAQWELGYSTYAFLPHDRIAVIAQNGAAHQLLIGKPHDLRPVAGQYTSIKPYLTAEGDSVAFIGSSAHRAPAVVLFDTAMGKSVELTDVDDDVNSTHTRASAQWFTARDGRRIPYLYWAPQPHRQESSPPTIVRAHPGPTANASGRLDRYVNFFTQHGYAVADVDYRGSTGHGRDHRNALRGEWGVSDAHDCVDAARHLIQSHQTDPRRTVISGASAGGYTALRALLEPATPFAAATATAAIVDPADWRVTTSRFQQHHADLLIGSWPGSRPTYRERSMLTHAAAVGRPVLLIHGDDDRIAPLGPVAALADALRASGTSCRLMIFPGEGHPPKSTDAVEEALAAELEHYRDALRRT